MNISIESVEGGEIKLIAEDVEGLEVAINVDAYYEPEDSQYIEGRCVAHLDEHITIEKTTVYIGSINGSDKYVDVHLDNSQKEQIIDGICNIKSQLGIGL